ncbi:CUB and sushi domain-containing protein 3 [Geodia barretti]|uniref:CUB and sushi domain-containing protein 3 n=1 Tax=Geodia barretti TaxID=519541 RepID=A0AA35TR10_GEOBA|nr:CUB and sushi domain-containing protein 3 [Geodia barretti]
MLKEKSMPTVWPSYLWSYRLIVMLVPALMANAQDNIVVGFERNLYNVSEGDSVTICVEIISPDDIGGNQLYLEVETVENSGQATPDEVDPIFGFYLMVPGADYPPLIRGIGQIRNMSLTQSRRSACYEQETYQDNEEESDEFFTLRVVIDDSVDSSLVVSNLVIDESRGTTEVRILGNAAVQCPTIDSPINGSLLISGTGAGVYQETATYACETGFNLVGMSERVCQSDGTWSGSTPTCNMVECPTLNDPDNGNLELSGNTIGQTAEYTCNDGFNLVGESSLICGPDGQWTGNPPVCVVVECPTLSDPDNGNLILSGNTFGQTAEYTCNNGFNLVGESILMCGADGQWIGDSPVCAVQCPTLDSPMNGSLLISGTGAGVHQETATYACDTGFNLVGIVRRVCQSGGMWSGSDPTCQIVECPTLNDPDNGNLKLSGNTFGDTAEYTCNNSFNLIGESILMCGPDGQWIGDSPVCEAVQCPTLDSPNNGSVLISGTGAGVYQETATYACGTGFNLVGMLERVCQSDAMWSGSDPTCQIVECPTLNDPDNGNLKLSGNTFGDTAEYTCNNGFNLIGESILMCGPDGQWIGNPPVCEAVQCPTLDSPNNGSVLIPGTGVGVYQETATYACETGFNLVGMSERVCQSDGTWSGSAPTCNIVECPTLNDPDNGNLKLSGNNFGQTAEYTCNTGFSLIGESILMCGADGQWIGNPPVCEVVQCPTLNSPMNGSVLISGTGVGVYQETATYACKTGFNLVGSLERVCQSDGTWSGSAPTCQIVVCPTLNDPANGNVNPSGYTFGQTAEYTCNTGFNLVGDSILTCGPEGQWSGNPPVCEAVQCPPIGSPVNGSLLISGTGVYQDTALYVCEDGLNLVGVSERVCQSDGTWSGSAPTCQRCPKLMIPNGAVNETGFTTGDVAVYYCVVGYLIKGDPTRTCGSDLEWTGSTPSCIRDEKSDGSSNTRIIIIIVTGVIAALLIAIVIIAIVIGIMRQKKKKFALPTPDPIYNDPDNPYNSSVLDKTEKAASNEIPLQTQPEESKDVTRTNQQKNVTPSIEQQDNVAYDAFSNEQQQLLVGDQEAEEQC